MAYVVDENGNPINSTNRFPVDIGSIGQGLVAVTPSDAADLSGGATKGLYVGVSGDVKITMANGTTATLPSMAAGVIHPLSAVRIHATGTTATGIFGVY